MQAVSLMVLVGIFMASVLELAIWVPCQEVSINPGLEHQAAP